MGGGITVVIFSIVWYLLCLRIYGRIVVIAVCVQGEPVTVVETVEVVKEVEKEVVKEVAPEDPDAGRVKLDTIIGSAHWSG